MTLMSRQDRPDQGSQAAAPTGRSTLRSLKLERTVGLLIAVLVCSAAGLLVLLIVSTHAKLAQDPPDAVVTGLWPMLYSTEAPSVQVVGAAVTLAVLMAAGVAMLERRFSDRYRRSSDSRIPLAPKNIMSATEGVFAGHVTVTVLIPAHNEEASLPATITSLLAQSHRPGRVIVIADNCTDATADLARHAGVEVFETIGNSQKKAGALNQALRELLPGQGDNDVVMVMDADTRLDAGFVEAAVARFTADRALMAVGALFYGEQGHGLLGQFQRNEYIRYARDIQRRRGRVFVLTGTASLFRPFALRTIAAQRGNLLPGIPGDVYDTAALTEDNELTIALKSLGALVISPRECTVVTELMPTWSTLWAQRLRWQRGALENIGAYGVTSQTFRYWAQQLGIGYGVIALSTYLSLVLITLLALDEWIWFPFWLGLGILFTIERVMTVWRGGWRARILAATLFPELIFDMVLNLVYVKGIIDISLGRRAHWRHLTPAGVPAATPAAASLKAVTALKEYK